MAHPQPTKTPELARQEIAEHRHISASVADKLDEARALIERGWTQGSFAINARGYSEDTKSEQAVCFCALGAIFAAERRSDTDNFSDAHLALRDALGVSELLGSSENSVVAWNDAKDRTQAEVIAAFRKAAELARADQVPA